MFANENSSGLSSRWILTLPKLMRWLRVNSEETWTQYLDAYGRATHRTCRTNMKPTPTGNPACVRSRGFANPWHKMCQVAPTTHATPALAKWLRRRVERGVVVCSIRRSQNRPVSQQAVQGSDLARLVETARVAQLEVPYSLLSAAASAMTSVSARSVIRTNDPTALAAAFISDRVDGLLAKPTDVGIFVNRWWRVAAPPGVRRPRASGTSSDHFAPIASS
jgi:hypothetical protein